MVQLSTPGVTPNRGMPPPVRRFLSNYFDLLLKHIQLIYSYKWIYIHILAKCENNQKLYDVCYPEQIIISSQNKIPERALINLI